MPFSVGLLIPKPLLQVWKANADGTGYALRIVVGISFPQDETQDLRLHSAFKHAVNLYSDAGTFITLLCAQTYLNLLMLPESGYLNVGTGEERLPIQIPFS